jgi:dienelactone hydrolase
LVGVLAGALAGAQCGTSTPADVPAEFPASPDPAARYLIYLHGRIVELQGRKAVSPEFGRYEYDGILAAFAARGFRVIAEVRPASTSNAFAEKVAGQVRKLLGAGVPASHITVVGFSRGGGLAVAASARVAERGVGYVLLAGCSQEPDWVALWAPAVHGRMLSLYDRSDHFRPSCAPLFAKAKGLSETREIELGTGLDHGLFYTPRPEWLDPLVEWANAARSAPR